MLHVLVHIAQLCPNEEIHTEKDLVQPKFHQSLGLKNTILLMLTDTQWGLYEKALFKAQSRMRSCKLLNSDEEGLAKLKFYWVKGFQ